MPDRKPTWRDDQFADLLVQEMPFGIGELVRFDHSKQAWYIWDGFIWSPDKTKKVFDLIHERVAYWMKAEDENGVRVFDAEDRVAMVSIYDTGRKESVLKALSSRTSIATDGTKWDPDPELMAFSNGVLNLKTGDFSTKPDPSLLLSRSTGHVYNPKADPTTFYRFVLQIMGGDVELAEYLVRVLGYALIGWQREQKFWMWVGGGSNGKGMLCRVLSVALGTYADTPPDTLYMRTRFGTASSDKPRPELLKLQGARFTWMSEPNGGQFNEEMLKAHSGNDPIQARDLYGKSSSITTFMPTHTIVFLTNNPPKTEDVGPSMRRRVRIIKFDQDYRPVSEGGQGEDNGLEDRLKEEANLEGALLLIASASKEYFDAIPGGGAALPEPAKVTEWSQNYIEENDPLAGFILESCVVGKAERGSTSLLWQAYQDWCIKNGNTEKMGSQTGFGMALGRRFKKAKTKSSYAYIGIRTKNAMELAADDE